MKKNIVAQFIVLIFTSFFSEIDRKSTRLNSSHSQISYAVFCLKKKKKKISNYPVKPDLRLYTLRIGAGLLSSTDNVLASLLLLVCVHTRLLLSICDQRPVVPDM